MAFRVLDSSAFYAGIPFSSSEPSVTTSYVYNEIKHIKKDHDAVQILIETRRLKISDPDHRFIITVNNAAKKSGDFPNLSQEDISTIALSLQLKAELVTDDFAVSNVATVITIATIKAECAINDVPKNIKSPIIILNAIHHIHARACNAICRTCKS